MRRVVLSPVKIHGISFYTFNTFIEMSIITILTILVLIIACAIPFVLIKRKNKIARNKFLSILLDHASSGHNPISQYELLNHQAIGISETSNFLYFLKRQNNKDTIQHVDLAKVERCYVNKMSRNSIDGNYSALEKIELRFATSEKASPEVVFELYNLENDSLSMNGELQFAEKWHSIIDSRLPRKKK